MKICHPRRGLEIDRLADGGASMREKSVFTVKDTEYHNTETKLAVEVLMQIRVYLVLLA